MTREEAIEYLNTLYMALVVFPNQQISLGDVDKMKESVSKAIEALKLEPCEDAISREAVLEQINCWIDSGEYEYTNATHYLTRRMQELPSVTPQPKIGHWIWTLEDWNKWECSECGFTKRTDVHVSIGYKFCPKCGARMKGREEKPKGE